MIYGLPERFENKIQPEPNSGCWLWLGFINPTGYGTMWPVKGGSILAYRAVYELLRGKEPRVLDHLCRNRCCVNPDHLEPVTHQINILRGVGIPAIRSKQTHCINGHELNPQNTYYRKDKRGRQCRMCHNKTSNRARDARRRSP